MNKLLVALLVGCLMWGCKSTEVLRRDLQTQSLIEEGKTLLRKESYAEAASVLESAAIRSASQSTSTALYLAGVAYFKANKSYPAEQQFTRLIRAYPKSKYIYEARYHRALLLLKKYDEEQKEEGVKTLFDLSIDRRRADLAIDADQALRNFLFYDAKASFLQSLFQDAAPAQRQLLAESLAYRLIKTNQETAARAVYTELKSKNGDSEFLKNMLGEEGPSNQASVDPDKNFYKVAVFLPLFLNDYTFVAMDEIPTQSVDALEFWEGFKQAIDEFGATSKKQIFVKVFDTRKSTSLVSAQLMELEKLNPDLIVGEVFTGPSTTIASWVATKKIPQLVPFSSNPSLLSDSSGFTFLARPIYGTHGSRMASHARENLNLKHVGIWTDQRGVTDVIANEFMKKFTALGGKVSRFPIDSVFEDRAQDDILDHFDDISSKDSLDGMYIPLAIEESAGLIMSTLQIRYREGEMIVMGTPSWERFRLIGQREKERFQLAYSSPFSEQHDSIAYRVYAQSYSERFKGAPTPVNTQGYGIGQFVATVLKGYDRSKGNLADRMRTLPSFKMPFSNLYFNNTQSNQYLPIFQFKNGYPEQVD